MNTIPLLDHSNDGDELPFLLISGVVGYVTLITRFTRSIKLAYPSVE
ncbi:MAG: hypothetical protein WB660_18225 [Candidatus Sulfotelmatobacter sp.]